MKVFISWSGPRSRAVAELLRDWLKCVLQATRPWISSRDVDRGTLWFNEINDNLRDTSVGVICVTHENKEKPWILFEAGALAKGLSSARVCTLLIDLSPSDVADPLAQFNHTRPDKDGMRSLVSTLNSLLRDAALEDKTVNNVFEAYWGRFESEFQKILDINPSNVKVEPRSEQIILAEILETTRSLSVRLRQLETLDAEIKRERSPTRRDEADALLSALADRGANVGEMMVAAEQNGISASLMLAAVGRRQHNKAGKR